MIKRAFTEHPASVGESYFEHMGAALSFSGRMIFGGLACMIHAFFPFLFVCTGRECITKLHERMVLHRAKGDCAADASAMPSLNTGGLTGADKNVQPAE